MCTNKHWIVNKYTNRSTLVNCGYCPACMQEKANKRKLRLLNHCPEGYDVYFFHLTYSDAFVPYIYIDDLTLSDNGIVDIYRKMECDVRFSPKNNCLIYNYKYDYVLKEKLISMSEYDNITMDELNKLHQISDDGRVGVLVYSDVQRFFKRLRSRLYRIPYVKATLAEKPLYYFCSGEYGETYSRPHWHILLYVPRMEWYGFEFFKRTVVSCWPYAYDDITEKRFEFAISPEKYVSQYINCSSDVSRFLLRSKIRPSWHYSHGFGRFNPLFQLGFLLDCFRKGTFTYNQEFTFKHGRKLSVALPFPAYVTNRFFPQFKGLRTLSYPSMRWFIQLCLSTKDDEYKVSQLNLLHAYENIMELSIGDLVTIQRLLKKSYNRYKYYQGLPCHGDFRFQYALDFTNFVSSKFRFLLSSQFNATIERDVLQSYDNVSIIRHCNPTLFGSFFGGRFYDSPFIVHPNEYDYNVEKTYRLTEQYNKYVKQKKANVLVYE